MNPFVRISSEELTRGFKKHVQDVSESRAQPLSFVSATANAIQPYVEENVKKFDIERAIKYSDIFSIDTEIKGKLDKKKSSLTALERKKKRLNWLKGTCSDSYKLNQINNKIFELERSIRAIGEDIEYRNYTDMTSSIMTEMKDINRSANTYSFVGVDDNHSRTTKRKRELVTLFLTIASKYIDIPPSSFPESLEDNGICECGNDKMDYGEDGKRICVVCGLTTTTMHVEQNSYKDNERLNLFSKYNYSKDLHFDNAIERLEGRESKNIPKRVYDKIYEEINKYEEYSTKTLTKYALYGILSKHGLSDYYENINKIHHAITKKPRPSYTSYHSALRRMNSQFEKVYAMIKAEFDKDNALNVNRKLMRFLEILGALVIEEDLIGLKTSSKKIEHDQVMERAFKIVGWNL